MIHSLVGLGLSLFILSACGSSSDPVNSNGDPIIAKRFKEIEPKKEEVPRFVTLLKLKSPALLETINNKSNPSSAISSQSIKLLQEEQVLVEKELKKISTDIKVVFKYRMVINALAINAPQSVAKEISNLNVSFIEADEPFGFPTSVTTTKLAGKIDLTAKNSMTFIGIDNIRKNLTVVDASGQSIPVKGKGIKVGIIDSGIDYTHKMFGGLGTEAAFRAIDPNKPTSFLTGKVVGGHDFAGPLFSTNSPVFQNQIPKPDVNPLDQGGHGTHVAGTVAGTGDGINTYDGAAPEATLYALKVFGDKGGPTSDTVVIAALEYAADPNADMDLSDRLDVVNLSLGGAFGRPHTLYGQAIKNIVNGGVVVVAAAGNAGPSPNIVGSPSTSEDALSVAASIDNMDQNILFAAAAFKSKNNTRLVAEAMEGAITKKIADAGSVVGELVYIGDAVADLTVAQVSSLQGKVALIDRGTNPFVEKIDKVKGAIGIVMINNVDGAPIAMGGNKSFDIPGVMIEKSVGDILKTELALGSVSIEFDVPETIEKPELIDTLASFSSRGPRSVDALIKPEVAAPGLRVISAGIGSGDKAAQIGGTSMSSPHIAGVAALLRQYRKNLTARQIKALIINTATLLGDEEGDRYPIARQGAGRVQADLAATSPILIKDPTISLGELKVTSVTKIEKEIVLTNDSLQVRKVNLKALNSSGINIKLTPLFVTIQPNQSAKIKAEITLGGVALGFQELDAFVDAIDVTTGIVNRIPVLAVVNRPKKVQPVVNSGILPGIIYGLELF